MAKVSLFHGQNYAQLKKQTQTTQQLFEDPEFPPSDASLYMCPNNEKKEVEWLRPGELVPNPQLFVDGTDSDDVIQGCLGNCWFAAAMATLAKNKKLLDLVIPNIKQQEWVLSTVATGEGKPKVQVTPQYGGIFKFRFWKMGQWVEIVVDDRLPVIDGKLIYIHSREVNEFWSALVEKAYAKLNGCFESLKTGIPGEALVDFTGGISETIKLSDNMSHKEIDAIFQKLVEVQKNHALIVANIDDPNNEQRTLPQGLVTGHTYSLTKIHDMKLSRGLFSIFNRERMAMIRLRNPWGEIEWKGSWSDGSEEWSKIPEAEKNSMGLVFSDDGEFWMDFADFVQFFTSINICEIFNTNIFNFARTWHEYAFSSIWNQRTAGGSPAHDSFLNNPQYLIMIKPRKGREGLASVVCHLSHIPVIMEERDNLQSPERTIDATEATPMIQQSSEKVNHYPIGITLIRVEINRECRLHAKRDPVETTTYYDSRDSFAKLKLPEGRYVMIPNTSEPSQTGDFYLRVFCDRKLTVTELTLHHPVGKWYLCLPQPQLCVQVDLVKAEGLIRQDQIGGADPYCVLTLGKQTSKSPVINDSLYPEWNIQFLFHPSNRNQVLTLRIWNQNVLKDDFLGQGQVTLPQGQEGQRFCRELTLKNGSHPQDLGTVSFVVHVYNDLRAI